MISIMKNTYTLFRKNKEFIYLITIQPLMIFLLMSFLLPYTTTHNVLVANSSKGETAKEVIEHLENLEGISLETVKEEKIAEKLMGGNAELAVLISDDTNGKAPLVSLMRAADTEIEAAVELCISETLKNPARTQAEVSVNAVRKKWIPISNTLAFMIFKTLTSANLLGALIIQERRNRMKDRIMLSGRKKSSYFLGMSTVYLLFMMAGSLLYYLVGLLLRFDFGMRNSLGFLLMLFISDILAISIYVFFAAFLKKEDGLGFVGTFVLMPMSLFAGVLFPYRFMPSVMQKIGACFPQRWIALAIEKMQESGAIFSAWKEMLMVLGLSVILFIVGMNCKSSELIKRRIKSNE